MDPSPTKTHRPKGPNGCVGNGGKCKAHPMKGCEVCVSHGGKAPQVRKKAAVRHEVMSWGLTDQLEDPSEVLLRLVAQSSRRASLYAGLLEQAYDAAERLQDGPGIPLEMASTVNEDAQNDLHRILNTGGVGVLIGHTYAAAKDIGIFASGEAIRGLVDLESQERDRCARFCKLAIDAGIEAKKVELAQRQVEMLDTVIRGILADLGHDPADRIVQGVVLKRIQALEA
jgi:hypothetical protein